MHFIKSIYMPHGRFLTFLGVPPLPSKGRPKNLANGNVVIELLDTCNADSHAQMMFTM